MFNSTQRLFSHPSIWKFCKFAKQDYDIVSIILIRTKSFEQQNQVFLHLLAADEISSVPLDRKNFQRFFDFSQTARERTT